MTTGALYSDIYADGNARQHNGNAYSTNTYKNTTESSNSHNGNTYNTNTQYGNNYSTTTHHGHVYNAPATTYNMPQSPNPFAQIMESAGQPTQLHRACAKGDEGLVRSLLDSGENIEAQNANFMTPLQVAVQKNQLNVVKLLLDRGANIEAKYRYWGASDVLILLAVHNHNEEMVRLLVDHGADTEETGRKLLTPLGVAAMEGQDRIVAVLWAIAKKHGRVVTILQNHATLGNAKVQTSTSPLEPGKLSGPPAGARNTSSPPQVGGHENPASSPQMQGSPPPMGGAQFPGPPLPSGMPQYFSSPPLAGSHGYPASPPPAQDYGYPAPHQFQQYQPSFGTPPPGFSSAMTSSAPPPSNDSSRFRPQIARIWKHAQTSL